MVQSCMAVKFEFLQQRFHAELPCIPQAYGADGKLLWPAASIDGREILEWSQPIHTSARIDSDVTHGTDAAKAPGLLC